MSAKIAKTGRPIALQFSEKLSICFIVRGYVTLGKKKSLHLLEGMYPCYYIHYQSLQGQSWLIE